MPSLPNGIICWVLGFPVFPPSFKLLRQCLRCLSHQSSRILTLTNQAKNIMPDLLSLMAIVGFAAIIFCCGWFVIFLCSRLWFDHLDRHQVDSQPYELPSIYYIQLQLVKIIQISTNYKSIYDLMIFHSGITLDWIWRIFHLLMKKLSRWHYQPKFES